MATDSRYILSRHSRYIRVLTLICLTAAAASGLIGQAQAQTVARTVGADGSASCLTVEGLESVETHATVENAPPSGLAPGETLILEDDVYTSAGVLTATSQATIHILYEVPSAGHLIASDTETLSFTDGTVDLAGLVDITDALAGDPWSLAALGVSGPYTGLVGILSIRNTSSSSGTSDLKLCD
jgi:Allene oxide cyclase barrel like domain